MTAGERQGRSGWVGDGGWRTRVDWHYAGPVLCSHFAGRVLCWHYAGWTLCWHYAGLVLCWHLQVGCYAGICWSGVMQASSRSAVMQALCRSAVMQALCRLGKTVMSGSRAKWYIEMQVHPWKNISRLMQKKINLQQNYNFLERSFFFSDRLLLTANTAHFQPHASAIYCWGIVLNIEYLEWTFARVVCNLIYFVGVLVKYVIFRVVIIIPSQ